MPDSGADWCRIYVVAMVKPKRIVSTSLRTKCLQNAAFYESDAGAGQIAIVDGVLPAARRAGIANRAGIDATLG
jgi:hypothetical protein